MLHSSNKRVEWKPVTFGFLTPLTAEAISCGRMASDYLPLPVLPLPESPVSSDDESLYREASCVTTSSSDAKLECLVNVFNWSFGRYRAQGVFYVDARSPSSVLKEQICDWLGQKDLIVYRLLRDADGGVLPIADLLEDNQEVGSSGVFGCNLFPRELSNRGSVGVSFCVEYRGVFEFVAPPLVVPLIGDWSSTLETVCRMVTSTESSRNNFLRWTPFSISFLENGGVSFRPLRNPRPLKGDCIAICLGSLRKGAQCVLNLPHESVVSFVTDVVVSEPFLSLILTSCSNAHVISHPWIFDISF